MFVEEMHKRKQMFSSVRIKLDGNCEHVLDMVEQEKLFFDAKIADKENMDPIRVT